MLLCKDTSNYAIKTDDFSSKTFDCAINYLEIEATISFLSCSSYSLKWSNLSKNRALKSVNSFFSLDIESIFSF
jgi:hypothetical protein